MSDEKETPKPEFTDYVHLRVEIPFLDKRFELLFRVHNLEVLRARPSFYEMLMHTARASGFAQRISVEEDVEEKDLN